MVGNRPGADVRVRPVLRCIGAARGRRYPARAHARSVGEIRRLRCAARPGGRAAELTTLNFVSLRSNSRGESDLDARKRADPQSWPCRPHRASGPAARQAQTVHWTVCVRACLLAAREIAPAGYRLPRAEPLAVFGAEEPTLPAKARAGRSECASEAASIAGLVAGALARFVNS